MYIKRLIYTFGQIFTAISNAKVIKTFSMNVVNIKKIGVDFKHVSSAVNTLLDGAVIALPTDTVYGIAALAQNDKAVADIYTIKQRMVKKPLAICVGDIEDLYLWGRITVPDILLRELLPGPVTLIFERTLALNPSLNPDTNLVGIRIPDNEFIRSVTKVCDSPLALTSANISSEESPLCVEEFKGIWDKLGKVFNSGSLSESPVSRRGSTIIDLSQEGYFKLIRSGCAYSDTIKILHKYGLKNI